MKAIDLTGQVFGRLTVVDKVPNRKGRICWNCLCECGNSSVVPTHRLRRGETRSCGCLKTDKRPDALFKDLTGLVSGRLTVLSPAGHNSAGVRVWLCSCECGSSPVIVGSSLSSGCSRSCGCLQRELTSSRSTTHGLSKTSVYNSWANMRSRCSNPTNNRYHCYGARGISVCDRWRDSFQNFYDDLGDPPTPEHSIERQDNDRNYNICNCYWADQETQANNRRTNVLLTFEGETMTVTQWGKRLGIARVTISARLKSGWSVEKALTAPVASNGGNYHTFNGQTKTLEQWGEGAGIGGAVLRQRLVLGWEFEKALTTSVHKKVEITFEGRTQTLRQWSKETGINVQTLRRRIRVGRSPRYTLTTPVGNQGKS